MRALRREQKTKRIKRAKIILRRNSHPLDMSEEYLDDRAKKSADNMKMCSCYLCCNPRHSFLGKAKDHLTHAEFRDLFDAEEQLAEEGIVKNLRERYKIK